jgi:hypothetical protein
VNVEDINGFFGPGRNVQGSPGQEGKSREIIGKRLCRRRAVDAVPTEEILVFEKPDLNTVYLPFKHGTSIRIAPEFNV